MPKYTRVAIYELNDLDELVLVSEVSSSYAGPAALAKKGDNTKKVGKEQEAYANKEQGIQDTARATADPFYKSLIPTQPGKMSPYAAADYGANVEKIANTYQNLRQAGLRQLGAKGFGNAPSGFGASMENTLLNQQGNALTGAFRSGLDETLREGETGAGYFAGEQQMYNPNAAYSGASSSYTAADQAANNAWKTGIGAATGLATAFIPGGGLAKLFKKAGGMGAPGTIPELPSGYTPPEAISSGPGFGALNKYANTGPSRYSPGFN